MKLLQKIFYLSTVALLYVLSNITIYNRINKIDIGSVYQEKMLNILQNIPISYKQKPFNYGSFTRGQENRIKKMKYVNEPEVKDYFELIRTPSGFCRKLLRFGGDNSCPLDDNGKIANVKSERDGYKVRFFNIYINLINWAG